MEDVDRMIVDNLVNDLQCSFAGKVSKLGDFDSAQLVEGIIRCIWRCRPASVATFPSYHLPTNPIERFRLASQISREIQTIGIRDQQQIGYHALLYPNVFDSRHIFLALFEHFPKEFVRPTMAEDQLSPTEKLKANVGAIIADQLKSKWKPEFCRFYDLQRIGRLWFPPPNATRDHHIFDAKMEEQSDFMTTTTCMEQKQPKIQNCKAAPQIAPKPRLSSKPLPLSPVSPFRDEIAANAFAKPILVPSSTHDVDEAKWQCAHEKVVQKRILLTQKRQTLAALHHANALLAEQCSARKHHQIGGGGDERLVQLLDEPEENLQKLEHYIACANSRRGALEQKFVDAERQRLSLLDDAALDGGRRRRTDAAEAGNNGVKVETEATTTAHPLTHRGGPKQAEELDCTIGALEQLLDQRQRIRQKLLRECQKVGENSVENGDGRAKYVQRILEMSAMVGKQNEEIRRTAKSVQNLRKEIEQLMGSLGRTFIAVNRWLSKDAEDNARMQRAYKLMVRTHEQCSLVMTCIEDQGQLSRHTDELIDKINIEQQKSVDEQLEKLLDDLMVINHENTELEKRFTHFSLKHVVE